MDGAISEGKAEQSMSERNRAVRILAKSIYKELTLQGYSEKQIVSLATELIGAVTQKIASGESRT
jgi:hypothetical protein